MKRKVLAMVVGFASVPLVFAYFAWTQSLAHDVDWIGVLSVAMFCAPFGAAIGLLFAVDDL